jgi:hypothetical protein
MGQKRLESSCHLWTGANFFKFEHSNFVFRRNWPKFVQKLSNTHSLNSTTNFGRTNAKVRRNVSKMVEFTRIGAHGSNVDQIERNSKKWWSNLNNCTYSIIFKWILVWVRFLKVATLERFFEVSLFMPQGPVFAASKWFYRVQKVCFSRKKCCQIYPRIKFLEENL